MQLQALDVTMALGASHPFVNQKCPCQIHSNILGKISYDVPGLRVKQSGLHIRSVSDAGHVVEDISGAVKELESAVAEFIDYRKRGGDFPF